MRDKSANRCTTDAVSSGLECPVCIRFWLSHLCPFGFLAHKTSIIWLSNLLSSIVPDEGYSNQIFIFFYYKLHRNYKERLRYHYKEYFLFLLQIWDHRMYCRTCYENLLQLTTDDHPCKTALSKNQTWKFSFSY